MLYPHDENVKIVVIDFGQGRSRELGEHTIDLIQIFLFNIMMKLT